MNRREFSSRLAAGILLAPFASLLAPRAARAAGAGTAAPKRLIIMTSLGTNKSMWSPLSAPGAALQLPTMLSPLAAIAADMLLVDGLSFANPTEGHSTPQTLTGFTFANGFGPSCTSVDQYIAAKVGAQQRLPSLLLGWQAKGEGQFWSGGRRLAALDNPVDAWQTAFAGVTAPAAMAAAAPAAMAAAAPAAAGDARQRVWQMIDKQIQAMATGVTGDNKARLQDHAQSMQKLLLRATAPALNGNCAIPPTPNLMGADANADSSQTAVAAAHIDLITASLACDVTRVVGMQFGVSNRQYIAGDVNEDEHSAIHSGSYFVDKVIGAEQAMCAWLVKLTQSLKSTPDPLAPGTTLLDNTLILWTRDIGNGPAHTQFSMPYVLVGGGDYLAKKPMGNYVNFGGDEATGAVGAPHQRLLLNLIEYMGAGAGQDFGTVSALGAAERSPLAQIRA